jgi:sugar phosphate isomerase/epimerase
MATIYLGSILLEPNRWAKDKAPTLRVSEWTERARVAGFDGIELWENHYRRALGGEAERQALRSSGSVTVFNSYAACGPEGRGDRAEATTAARELGRSVKGVKFNVGKTEEPARLAQELRATREWAETLPAPVRLLCECHPGTALETPDAAAKAFTGEWADTRRFAAIVHPFSQTAESLRTWVDALGPRIAHLHVQTRMPDDRIVRLDRRAAEVREVLRVLRAGGILPAASFTLEFTEGTRTPDGDVPEKLWENALRDLAFLREELGA